MARTSAAPSHPAIGRAQQPIHQQPPRLVTVPDVILHIETFLGCICEHQARDKGLHPVLKRVQTRLSGMRGGERCDSAPEDRRVGTLNRA